MPTINDYIRDAVLNPLTGGLTSGGSPAELDQNFFVGNEDAIRRTKLREYDTWLGGDTDRIAALYRKDNMIDFATEPWFWKTRQSFFWCVVSTESDVKCTHSGQPANIIYTMCNIVGTPECDAADPKVNEELQNILEECEFKSTYRDEQLPMTLVEGWGAFKVGWDLDVSDLPYVTYYRAENVQFVKVHNKLMGIAFYDWYKGKNDGERYLVTEIRRLESKLVEGHIKHNLVISSKVWKATGEDNITPVTAGEVPAFVKCSEDVVIEDFDGLLATPCIIYKDATDSMMPGKSVFANKIALFDMLDGILSQQDNAIQKSTVEELFNTDFLERDKNNMPIMPKRYDRKYTTFAGGRTADGGQMSAEPVQVTQPNIDFSRYSRAAIDCLSHTLSGFMSPATVGIGVATEATAASQREKEKVTISTRNSIIGAETPIWKEVCNDLLICNNYLKTGKFIKKDYDISIKFSEFASDTFEAKSQIYTQMLTNGAISPELFVDKLWGDELSEDDKAKYVEFLSYNFDPAKQQQMAMGSEGGVDPLAAMMAEAE